MKKLLLTTGLLTFSTIGGTSLASASTASSLTKAEFSEVYTKISVTSAATGLHSGDYQVIAKALQKKSLYDGMGSALMKTIRLERY